MLWGSQPVMSWPGQVAVADDGQAEERGERGVGGKVRLETGNQGERNVIAVVQQGGERMGEWGWGGSCVWLCL